MMWHSNKSFSSYVCLVSLLSAAVMAAQQTEAAAVRATAAVGPSAVVTPSRVLRSSARISRRQLAYGGEPGGEGANYAFSYEVDAPEYGIYHDRRETSSGAITEGRFRVALPDHRLQTVTYQATNKKGFVADVQFEQHPDFHALRGNIGKAPVIGEPVISSFKATRGPQSLINKNISPFTEPKQTVTIEHGYQRLETSAVPQHSYKFLPGNSYGKRRRRPTQTSSYTKDLPLPVTSLSAFVSIAPYADNQSPSIQDTRNLLPATGYSAQSAPTVGLKKKQVPSRPLRTKHRTTLKPTSVKVIKTPIDHYSLERPRPSYGEKHRPSRLKSSSLKSSLPAKSSSFRPSVGKFSSLKSSIVKSSSFRPFPAKPSSLRPSNFKSTDKRPLVSISTSRKPSSSPPSINTIPVSLTIPHLPEKDEPIVVIAPPATQDESFSISGKSQRYAIRQEGMNSIRSRLNSIVHDK